MHPLDVAGAIEQGIQQLFRTERPGLSRGDVQAGGLGMTVADLVYAGAEDRQRRVGISDNGSSPLRTPGGMASSMYLRIKTSSSGQGHYRVEVLPVKGLATN